MANVSGVNSSIVQHDEDGQDQIGSMTTTPSGIATPQPDPSDKRLPGIMHSFFAQVGASSDSGSGVEHQGFPSVTSTAPQRLDSQAHSKLDSEKSPSDRGGSLSGSTVMLDHDSKIGAPEPRLDSFEELRTSDFNPLPTPPHSSSSFCSISQKDGEVAENGGDAVNRGMSSIYQALRNFILPKTAVKNIRRHTSYPVSSITHDSVHATHFSNPCLPASSPDASQHISKSSEELVKLTDNAGAAPRIKNTPPLTPRAMSNELHPTDKRSVRSLASSPAHSQREARTSDRGSATPTGSSSSAQGSMLESAGPAVAPLKGKLTVKIAEGRGLRPSYDPYVVCVFEWNEYISKGAHHEQSHQPDNRNRNQLDARGSVPIQRSNSDSGRPMAIPMKSRQSSQNSVMDGYTYRVSNQVTDPQWNHEAVLYVERLSSMTCSLSSLAQIY